jgi:hypothetical protein
VRVLELSEREHRALVTFLGILKNTARATHTFLGRAHGVEFDDLHQKVKDLPRVRSEEDSVG